MSTAHIAFVLRPRNGTRTHRHPITRPPGHTDTRLSGRHGKAGERPPRQAATPRQYQYGLDLAATPGRGTWLGMHATRAHATRAGKAGRACRPGGHPRQAGAGASTQHAFTWRQEQTRYNYAYPPFLPLIANHSYVPGTRSYFHADKGKAARGYPLAAYAVLQCEVVGLE